MKKCVPSPMHYDLRLEDILNTFLVKKVLSSWIHKNWFMKALMLKWKCVFFVHYWTRMYSFASNFHVSCMLFQEIVRIIYKRRVILVPHENVFDLIRLGLAALTSCLLWGVGKEIRFIYFLFLRSFEY